jgi:hypothetical protein
MTASPRKALLLLGFVALACTAAPAAAEAPASADPGEARPPVSASAQRAYETTRDKLLQVRTLLKDQDSQASVGSGFVVTTEGHVITNYHVVSQVALQPQRYRLTYTRAEGAGGALQLLAFDAVHDLALLRMLPTDKSSAVPPQGVLTFRSSSRPLAKGERIYSLGNPLDVGFAVLEGNYNGLVERSFYPQIFFGGALNPGMSGGPALDSDGRVIGVNVATRLDGQQVSFLVPAQFAQELLKRGRDAQPITTEIYPELTRQLIVHQSLLVERFAALPWRSAGHERYRIPVPQEDFMRCWGSSTPADTPGLEYQRSDCDMDTAVFISDRLQTGDLTVRHEVYDGRKLGTLRFARVYSESFRNEAFGRSTSTQTAPQCKERFVDRDGLPLRAVVCMSAYRKLKGLYNLSVLVATVDANTQGAQGRLDARGIDFDNALRLTEHYLQGYAWTAKSH